MEARAKSLSKSLRHHFGTQNVPLSRFGSITEAFAIVAVRDGYRHGALLSSCMASKGVLVALQDALSGDKEARLAIIVHQASQQIFVVNADEVMRQNTGGRGPVLYYAIDAETKDEQRAQHDPPRCLQSHLTSFCCTFMKRKSSKHDPPVFLLGSEDENALHGVALAGWLLGYHVVYFFRHIPCFPSACRQWSREEHLVDGPWTGNDTTANCLAGTPLIVVKVSASDGHSLFQYTFPISILRQVSASLGTSNDVLTVVDAIQQRILHQTNRSVLVTHEIVTKDRLAL